MYHWFENRIDPFAGKLVTTSAVITEAMHFVSPSPQGPALLAEFIVSSRTRVEDLSQPPDLLEAVALMDRYADTPMDFADATLVLLAERLDSEQIVTLDRRGFSVYRTPSGRAFSNVLDLPGS